MGLSSIALIAGSLALASLSCGGKSTTASAEETGAQGAASAGGAGGAGAGSSQSGADDTATDGTGGAQGSTGAAANEGGASGAAASAQGCLGEAVEEVDSISGDVCTGVVLEAEIPAEPSCTLELAPTESIVPFDPTLITLFFQFSDASISSYPRLASLEACEASEVGGWYPGESADGAGLVHLCPCTCALLAEAQVFVAEGCSPLGGPA